LNSLKRLVCSLPVRDSEENRTETAHQATSVSLHELGPETYLGEELADGLLKTRLLLCDPLEAVARLLEQPRRVLPRLAHGLVHRGLAQAVPRVERVGQVEVDVLREAEVRVMVVLRAWEEAREHGRELTSHRFRDNERTRRKLHERAHYRIPRSLYL